MRLLLKLFAAPVMLVLTILAAMLMFCLISVHFS